jgi:hypothetical protein
MAERDAGVNVVGQMETNFVRHQIEPSEWVLHD